MKEATLSVQGLSVRYAIVGQGPAVLILHGWGSSGAKWGPIQEKIALAGFRVIALDLPGFGKTLPPKEVWGVKEYASFVSVFAKAMNLGKFTLVGHSFGGQIGILFAVNHADQLEKLVLLAAAGVRREPGNREKVLGVLAKAFKSLLFLIPSKVVREFLRRAAYRLIGRRDYAASQGIMREIFKRGIREDLTPLFSRVSVPTLLLWGEKDEETPLEDGYIMEENIPNSSLLVFPGVGHRLRKEAPEELLKAVIDFLEKQS